MSLPDLAAQLLHNQEEHDEDALVACPNIQQLLVYRAQPCTGPRSYVDESATLQD